MKCKLRKSVNANNSCTSIMKLICLFTLVIATSALRIQKQAASKKDYDFKAEKEAVIAELDQRFDGYREHCYPLPDDDFKAEKEAVIAELDQRFDGYREHCYPLPGDGCRCQETENGAKVSKEYKTDFECKTDEKRKRLCEDKQCKQQFNSINRCQTKEKCGQDKWAPYESCLKECMKIHPLPSSK
ncbi:hypothetical protein T11_17702 [Trichinella zimbabwensis]|uniref:Uncharacterized protein n=1 Tax=Trichinella zimbabwensis TaxID=268475 RepID=A0A0V1GY48_9BILA|nr:hypothetical protein T11_17702 [Trichinella zimbabwensis]